MKYKPKYISLKNVNVKNEQKKLDDEENNKENINININLNDIKPNKNLKINSVINKDKIKVNKRNRNLVFDIEKSKYFLNNNNNSNNSAKNSYIYKYHKNRIMNFTLKTMSNNSSFLNIYGKDGSMTQRNAILSYKHK